MLGFKQLGAGWFYFRTVAWLRITIIGALIPPSEALGVFALSLPAFCSLPPFDAHIVMLTSDGESRRLFPRYVVLNLSV